MSLPGLTRLAPRRQVILALAVAALGLGALAAMQPTPVRAADEPMFELTLKDHKFEPAEIKVPAGKAFKIKVKNLDSTPEEFESHALKLEKVVAGGKEITVSVRPLKAGTYKFVGEYNEATANGAVIAE